MAKPSKEQLEFEQTLASLVESLERRALVEPEVFRNNPGEKFEKVVLDELSNGSYEGKFRKTKAQDFPDIVCDDVFGIEIKTTKGPGWITTGNSVTESTRIKGVKYIYILMCNLSRKISFKYGPYEKHLSKVLVTHNPRYEVDMQLKDGESIFDKMGTPYDELRKKENPASEIKKYYSAHPIEGRRLWWHDSEIALEPYLETWSQLSTSKKTRIRLETMVLFPEIFGDNKKKYSRIPSWLVTEHNVMTFSLRDIFSSKGTKCIPINGVPDTQVPRIVAHLVENLSDIDEVFKDLELQIIKTHWIESIKIQKNREKSWIRNLTAKNMKKKWIKLVDDNLALDTKYNDLHVHLIQHLKENLL